MSTNNSTDNLKEIENFLRSSSYEQKAILEKLEGPKIHFFFKEMEPDDLADLFGLYDSDEQQKLMGLLDHATRTEVKALLFYHEDVAGGLMNTRYARLRPEMSVGEALKYLKAQAQNSMETIYYNYVLSNDGKLLGAVSLRQLFYRDSKEIIQDFMACDSKLIRICEGESKENIAKTFSKYSYLALPVVDSEGYMKGILTVDDIVDVVQDVATEDIHKMGGLEALDGPYFQIGFFTMIKKRAGWLLALFIGEMFTATAMSHYEDEIAKAVVLAIFIPLIISSGGNSGSQATTLIIRAMALGEIRLRDWWKVFFRELCSGISLGVILGLVGLTRIILWPARESLYGEHYVLIALAVGSSLIGIVAWGTLAGSMLPFILRTFKLDPATASAPFVATLVDVTGLIIYFTIASLFLRGVLL